MYSASSNILFSYGPFQQRWWMFNQDHAVRGVWLGLAGVKRLLEAWVKRCWRTSKDNVWSSGQFLCDYMSEPVYYSAGSNTWGIRNLSGRINRGSQLCDFIKYDLTITPLNTTATLFYFIISYFPRQICQSCWQASNDPISWVVALVRHAIPCTLSHCNPVWQDLVY